MTIWGGGEGRQRGAGGWGRPGGQLGPQPHLAAHPQAEALVLPGDSSNHGHRADAQRLPELDGLLLDLLGQLSGGSQDDGVGALVRLLDAARHRAPSRQPRCLPPPRPRTPSRHSSPSPVDFGQGCDPHQQRDEEGRRLPAAGLSHADDVAVLQADGDGLPLDGGGFLGSRAGLCQQNSPKPPQNDPGERPQDAALFPPPSSHCSAQSPQPTL